MTTTAEEAYAALSAPFEQTFSDVRGGVSLTYITGEQVVSRLNEVLTITGWSFHILEHGINESADEAWVLADLTVKLGDEHITRQQFGSQKIKRSRQTGMPLDLGFDLKGATTDALKKCAQGVGVGLYLSKRENKPVQQPNRSVPVSNRNAPVSSAGPLRAACFGCGKADLAYGGVIDRNTYCGDCYKERKPDARQ